MIGQSRTRLLGVSVLVAMFVAGGLTGAVVQRTAQADSTKPSNGRPARGPGLSEKLQLTAAQKQQVCAIRQRNAEQMKPHDLAVQATWKEHETAIRAIMSETEADIDAVLTPEQHAIKEQYRAERKKFFEAMKAKEKNQKPDSTKERRGRPGPLGVVCPGIDDVRGGGGRPGGSHGGPRGGMPWGGDSSRDRGKGAAPAQTAPAAAAKTEHQS